MHAMQPLCVGNYLNPSFDCLSPVGCSHGGETGVAGPGSFTPTHPPPPLPPWKLAPKCRTISTKGALRQICLNH